VPYGLHLEPRSEASKEAAKKRRNDTGAELVGKCATGSDSLKAHAAPKGTSVALLKAASSHARSTPKAGAPPKSGVPPKAIVLKSVATQALPKARVLQISTGVKRSASAEPSLTPMGKHAKVNVAPSPASAPILRAIVRLQPLTESDDGHVVACAMLGASSVVSSLSSSLNDSYGSESIMALLPLIPNLLISAGLDDTLEMPDGKTAHQSVETIATIPHADTSAGMFMYIL
jgi:hypothetical protein